MQSTRQILSKCIFKSLGCGLSNDVLMLKKIDISLYNQVRHFTPKDVFKNYWIDSHENRTLKTRLKSAENISQQNDEFLQDIMAERMYNPLNTEIIPRHPWENNSKRTGLIGRKIGSQYMWTNNGGRCLASLVQVMNNTVVRYISPEELLKNDVKYMKKCPSLKLGALIVGAEDADPRMLTKEYLNLFKESGVFPKRKITKFYITPNARLASGTPLYASHFQAGSRVDIVAKSIYRGWQGVMKRWGFKGLRATHGVTKSHRAAGNTSGGKKDGHWKGTKLAGFMGGKMITKRGIEILRINTKYNVIYLNGPTPGAVNDYMYLHDSFLAPLTQTKEKHEHFPTFFQEENEIEEDMYAKHMHNFLSPSLKFE